MIAGVLGVASGLMSGISGYRAGKKAAKKAKEVGKLRAGEYLRQAGNEMEYNTDQQKAIAEAQARRMATIGTMYSKSGLMLTGTPKLAMEAQKEADAYTIEQASKAGSEQVRALNTAAKMERKVAGSAARALETEGRTALVGGLFSAGDALAGWMGQPKKQPDNKKQNGWGILNGFFGGN